MRQRRWRWGQRTRHALLLLGPVALLGCADEPTVVGEAACASDVALSISAAAAPVFSWTPACTVNSLYVGTMQGAPAWTISSEPLADRTPTNTIASGVTFGAVPAGAHQSPIVAPLEPGVEYVVSLWVSDSQGNHTKVAQGSFTP